MANTLKIGSAFLEVDWSLMMQDAYELQDLGKVAHVQPYLPGPNGSPTQQPFILILRCQGLHHAIALSRVTATRESGYS